MEKQTNKKPLERAQRGCLGKYEKGINSWSRISCEAIIKRKVGVQDYSNNLLK